MTGKSATITVVAEITEKVKAAEAEVVVPPKRASESNVRSSRTPKLCQNPSNFYNDPILATNLAEIGMILLLFSAIIIILLVNLKIIGSIKV